MSLSSLLSSLRADKKIKQLIFELFRFIIYISGQCLSGTQPAIPLHPPLKFFKLLKAS